MRGPLLPVLLLAVLPAAYFALRLGLLRRPAARWTAAALAALAILWALPWGGVDFVYLKRLTLVLSLAAMAVVLLRYYGGAFALSARQYTAALAGLAAASLTVYLNFFSFHGQHTWVHLHDVAHYYLGAKYFDELGYEHLYTAMLRAEGELTPGRFSTLEARDLSTNELVPIRELLLRSDEVKAGFTPERWEEWKRDVALFRDALGPQFKSLYADHGFNPTPLWPVMGGTLARLVPAGSRTGVLLLSLLDPLLLAAAFAAVAWAFGRPAALLGIIHFCLVYGASFGWTGGAFLRYVWFAAVLVAAAACSAAASPWPAGCWRWPPRCACSPSSSPCRWRCRARTAGGASGACRARTCACSPPSPPPASPSSCSPPCSRAGFRPGTSSART
jgi:hypothetical protein